MNNTSNKQFLYNIVDENKYRLNILNKSNQLLLKEYDLYHHQMFNLADSLYKQISFSTNKIRRDFLLEQGMNKNATYHLSRSRVDRYNGYNTQNNIANQIYNSMIVGLNEYAYLFITIDYIQMYKFLVLDNILNNMKYIYKQFTYTDMFKQLNGLVIKHELSFKMLNNRLCLIPHTHLILKLTPNLISTLVQDIYKYFSQRIITDDKAIDIKTVNNTDIDFLRVAKYTAKDFYMSVFHSKDNIIIPYNHIVYVLLMTKNFRYINTYKDLNIKITK